MVTPELRARKISEYHNPKFAIADMVLESLEQLDDNIWDFVNL